METLAPVGYTAKTLATMLVDECDELYGHAPGDDATACVVRIRKREPMNLLFGPPFNRDDADRMMSLFFSKEGKHIVCGGTTSPIAAKYLGKPLVPTLSFERSDVPPIAEIEGVDLVTEGVITMNKVVEYAKDYLGDFATPEEGVELFMACVLNSPCETAMLPMQDILHLGGEARMNLPGSTGGNWAWRMKPGAASDEVAAHLKEMNTTAKRG